MRHNRGTCFAARWTTSHGYLLLAMSFAAAAFAQNSQISGRVLDPSQAGLPSAKVSATRVETGDRRETKTSGEGYYAFPSLVPGQYQISVEKEGFAARTISSVTVETGQTSAVDVTLDLGQVAESVTVEAAVPQLQAETSAVTKLVTSQAITDMPLLDRRSGQLTRLNGFIVPNNSGQNFTAAIAGGRGNNTNYFMDGATAQNVGMGTPTLAFDPPIEAMQEFNVNVSNYAAELGRTGGGVIQMTTKSGTNTLHGSVYEFFRNDVLNSNTYYSTAKPPLRYNLFGASIGGPIRKDRTHYFFNYEGRRQGLTTTRTLVLPNQAQLSGDFIGAATVRDPLNGQAFPNNIIPRARLDSVGAKLASYYPAPNVAGAAPGAVNFIANNVARTVTDTYVARVDHVFGDNDRIFVRFNGQPSNTNTPPVFATPGTDQFGAISKSYFYGAGGTWTHTLSPTTISTLRLGITQRESLSIHLSSQTPAGKELGLRGQAEPFFPSVTVAGFQQLGAPQSNTGSGQLRLQTPVGAHSINHDISKLFGAHQLKFGWEYRYNSDGDLYQPSAGGALTFNTQATGNSVASLLLGWVNQGSVLSAYPLDNRLMSYGGYFQDDWRVTSRLNINIGIRFDIDSPRYDVNDRQNAFNPSAINPISGTPGVITFSNIDGQSKYAHRWDKNNFGPRLGFSYKASDKWVIRGGGGLVYMGAYDFPAPVILYTGYSTQGTFLSSNNGATPAFILANGFPALSSPTTKDLTPGYGAVKVGQSPTTAVTFFKQDRSTGYLLQANIDIQRQITQDTVLDVGYLGTFGRHLPAPDFQGINQVPTALLGAGNLQSLRPFPQFANVQILGSDVGASKYNGVNIGLDRRMSAGLQLKFNYTYSKFLDNVASRSELGAPTGVTATFTDYYNQANNWGLSGNDIRHRLVLSSTYALPLGKLRAFVPSSGILNQILAGWSLAGIVEFRSGTPLSPFELVNNTNSYSDGVRPNVVGDWRITGDRARAEKLDRWFDTSAFAAPAPYTFGNAGRSFGTGPGAYTADASLLKDFKAERLTAQFRAEILNLTNHANFANPDTRRGSPTFGRITSLVPGNQARIIQLGLHLKF